ncbi:MAG: cyclic nucleotide-binding domain-containing protein [Mariprofundaceae bacterium]|nr:cyclic nucleotide-binding domain-containing protein [Mariprofundaceae bacterium]
MIFKSSGKPTKKALLKKARTAQDTKDYQQAAYLYLEHAHQHEKEERKQAEQFLRAAQCFERIHDDHESAHWYLKAAERYTQLSQVHHALSALKACYRISADKAPLHQTITHLIKKDLWHDDMFDLLSKEEQIYYRINRAKKFKESVFSSIQNFEEFQEIMPWISITHAVRDEVVIRFDDPEKHLFFLVSGQVEALIPQETRIDSMGYIHEMEILGESSFFLDAKRITQIIAVRECTLLKISYEHIPKLQAYLPNLKSHMKNLYRERILLCRLAVAPVFSELNTQARKEIANHIILVRKKKGEYLFKQNDTDANVYIILSGRLGIQLQIQNKAAILKKVAINATIGEISIINEHRRTASAIALSNTTLLCIPESYFQQLYNEHAELRWVLKVRKQSQTKESHYFVREEELKHQSPNNITPV